MAQNQSPYLLASEILKELEKLTDQEIYTPSIIAIKLELLQQLLAKYIFSVSFFVIPVQLELLFYNYPEELLADPGVMTIEYADFHGIKRLAIITGEEIVIIVEDTIMHFSGVPLGGASPFKHPVRWSKILRDKRLWQLPQV
ncbi:hypothetical protein TKK_0013491 [Trichogramma kaykai]